ncbi:MAG: YceI family protein [Planctomycetota bacterium]|nr:YceI family protein [Planctomycetota bacterium]
MSISASRQEALPFVAAFLSIAVSFNAAHAQNPATASRAAIAETPLARGDIDPKLSRFYAHVGKTGFGHEHGVEARLKSGHLQLGADRNAGEIVIDMTSFKADSDEARKYVGLEGSTDAGTRQGVDTNMLGPDVLNVAKYPTAVFKVSSIQQVKPKRPNAKTQYKLDGDFTLHGKTNKLSVLADVAKVEGFLRVYGHFSILQSDFGITPYRKVLGAVGVADRLTIWGELWVVE